MAESNEMLGQGCICTIRNHGRVIEFCPLHKAAPEMLKALENAITISQRASDFLPGAWQGIPANQGAVTEYLERLRSFCRLPLAAARSQEVGA